MATVEGIGLKAADFAEARHQYRFLRSVRCSGQRLNRRFGQRSRGKLGLAVSP
jgi:hypothetical protein